MNLIEFMDQFYFVPAFASRIGIENEAFTARRGVIVPEADTVLTALNGSPLSTSFGPELSKCQIEWRTPPLVLADQEAVIRERIRALDAAAKSVELRVQYTELAPPNMPLAIYPDLEGRYKDIVENLDKNTLLTGCRVAGVHVHVGMPDAQTALRVYNHARKRMQELIKEGICANGGRMRLYKQMAPAWNPPAFDSWTELHQYALQNGWADKPKDWWALIRISRYGTIEFRPFGSTRSVDRMMTWGERCLSICNEVM